LLNYAEVLQDKECVLQLFRSFIYSGVAGAKRPALAWKTMWADRSNELNNGGCRMLDGTRLPDDVQKPVYYTRNVAAHMADVNFRTFETHSKPAAWRRELDGKLSPLYDDAAVEAFRAEREDREL
jgi:hypothetical protein